MKHLVFIAAISFAQPAFALDDCLVGNWSVDNADMAQALGAQLNGSAEYVSGEALMAISEAGEMRMLVSNITLKVQIPNAPEMQVTVAGHSTGTITADAGAWTLVGGDYTLNGSAFVLGQSMSIPFSSSSGLFSGGMGSYSCDSDNLLFETDGDVARLPHRWHRLPEG